MIKLRKQNKNENKLYSFNGNVHTQLKKGKINSKSEKTLNFLKSIYFNCISIKIISFIAYFSFNTVINANIYILSVIVSTSHALSYLSLEIVIDRRNCYQHFIGTEFGVQRS